MISSLATISQNRTQFPTIRSNVDATASARTHFTGWRLGPIEAINFLPPKQELLCQPIKQATRQEVEIDNANVTPKKA